MAHYTLPTPYLPDWYNEGPTIEHQATRCGVLTKVAHSPYIIPCSKPRARDRDVMRGVEVLSDTQARTSEGCGWILGHLEGRVEELRGRREDLRRRQVATREAVGELVNGMVGVATHTEVGG